ncbi:tRNA 2'-phosphotransferase 1 [Erysiphe neolycopersici]|uniref:2'-phosphotransferase n=1 Tax=Erysiphe neolycopersici TaxID=212602 RepID=A0A420HV29_9PEZI|nr:tRNA 2'-phosphotransferase 1 [Erysiphe neolycopersici]
MATSKPPKSPDKVTPPQNKSYRRARGNNGSYRNEQNENSAFQGNHKEGRVNKQVAVSKALSKLLRHAANEAGLKLDSEAYARVDQVLQWQRLKSLHVTFADIQKVVNEDVKNRFSLKSNSAIADSESNDPSDWVIRANQGHSINVDSAKIHIPITIEMNNIPEIVVHGTYYYFYSAIIKSGGLSRMTRTHIHFSDGKQREGQKVVSGMRKDAELLIYINIRASIEDGILWWLSDNGVVLTEGDDKGLLPLKYFKRVVAKNSDIGILMEDGVETKKLPESQEFKIPMGKMHKVNNRRAGVNPKRRENYNISHLHEPVLDITCLRDDMATLSLQEPLDK